MHVIATAGHVDHGKSTLVRALTGMEPDRWAEERERGMTIDLGYAWTTLPSGASVAFVDVPGHERFVTNMLAGVGPVPAVLLVVAADEGWGRQTSEHLAALDALGVRHGVLAVTRSDLGDAAVAIEQARDRLGDSGLADIDAVAVSPVTGAGLDDLRATLDRLVAALPAPPDTAVRLWIDRVFSVRGAGDVVTGTLQSGTIAVGDELRLMPSGERVQVRGLQTLKTTVFESAATARVAVNVRIASRRPPARGDALVAPGMWRAVSEVDARLVGGPAKLPAEAVLHVGSAAVAVRIRPLGIGAVRLALHGPLPLHVGDRGLLRDPGRQRVLCGIIALDVDPPALTRRGAARTRAGLLAALPDQPDPGAEIDRRGAARRDRLVANGVLPGGAAAPAGVFEHAGWLVSPAQWSAWRVRLDRLGGEWSERDPLAPGVPAAHAARELGLPDVALLDPLVASAAGIVSDGLGVHRADTTPTLTPRRSEVLQTLLDRLAEHPFGAPDAAELAALGLTDRELAVAVRDGRLVRLSGGVFLAPAAVDEAVRRLRDLPQPFTLSAARQALGTTRRVAVPLLELLDAQRLTRRVDSQQREIA